MSSNLLSLLRIEERQLLAELRASATFQKLEAVRRVVGLYAGGGSEDTHAVDLLLGRAAAELLAEPGPAPSALQPVAAQPIAAPPQPASVTSAAPAREPAASGARAEAPAAATTMTIGTDPIPGAANNDQTAELLREGSKAVSAVRAALLAVTR